MVQKVRYIPMMMVMKVTTLIVVAVVLLLMTMRMLQTSEGEGVVFTKMPGNISVTIDSSVLLECAVSDPQADVMWSVSLP